MSEFVQFIENNYQFICLGIIALVELIFAIIRKKSKVEIIDDSIFSRLVYLVIEAESVIGSGKGDEKLQYVLSHLYEEHPSYQKYGSYIKSLIEIILESPQKKGVKND